jgi:hypothetical protein
MISIIMPLAQGNAELSGQFSEAVAAWKIFHSENLSLSEKELAKKLSAEQFRHEMHFEGDRHLGKMSMPLAALAALYDETEGFDSRRPYAIRLAKAFSSSSVSIEVKGSALIDAIIAFDLEDDSVLKDLVKRRLGL